MELSLICIRLRCRSDLIILIGYKLVDKIYEIIEDTRETAMRKADWFFDFISPYAYLQYHQIHRLPDDIELHFRPVLFSGLLNHWGQLGPAEIRLKKQHTFLLTRWRAHKLGLPFNPPPRHPFNPLLLLRLALALKSDRNVVGKIFDHVWAKGGDGQDVDAIIELSKSLGVLDLIGTTGNIDVKNALRRNTEEAVKNGIYGVPSFLINGQSFWGDDMFDFMLEWLVNPSILTDPEVQRIMALPSSAERNMK